MFNSSNRGGARRSPVQSINQSKSLIASWSPLGRHYDRHFDRLDDRLVHSLHIIRVQHMPSENNQYEAYITENVHRFMTAKSFTV